MGRAFLGEFEQRVLLAIIRCEAGASPIEIRKEIARASGHDPSRGAFYTTLDRLEAKQLVRWTAQEGSAGRDGLPQRTFVVTPEGMKALRASRKALLELWNGLEEVLGES
jgi:DNA-binding PadR family transcriptional regulator